MGAFTTMTSKGQLTIPKDVRDALKLGAGTRFYVTESNGQVVALPKNKRLTDLAGFLGLPPTGAGASLEDIDDAIGQFLGEEDERIKREWNEGAGKGK